MCVYSVNAERTRKASRGQKVVTHDFGHTIGFAAENDRDEVKAAICLFAGSELSFRDRPHYFRDFERHEPARAHHRDATVRQINAGFGIEDAVEFPDGFVLPLRQLKIGQAAKVLSIAAAEISGRATAPDGRAAARERVNA